MRLHRFFVGTAFDRDRETDLTDGDLVHQLSSVLRLREGSSLVLLDGKGNEADAEIVSVGKKAVRVRVGAARTSGREAERDVTLCCAVLRRENFEWVVQKATESGAKRIIPLLTERTVKTGLNAERLRRIAIEAMEQCGRGTFPSIDEPMTLAEAAQALKDRPSVFFHLGGDPSWETRLGNGPVACWIGPEGGWSDAEAAWATERGYAIASLGGLTLRAETAAVVATYLAGR